MLRSCAQWVVFGVPAATPRPDSTPTCLPGSQGVLLAVPCWSCRRHHVRAADTVIPQEPERIPELLGPQHSQLLEDGKAGTHRTQRWGDSDLWCEPAAGTLHSPPACTRSPQSPVRACWRMVAAGVGHCRGQSSNSTGQTGYWGRVAEEIPSKVSVLSAFRPCAKTVRTVGFTCNALQK